MQLGTKLRKSTSGLTFYCPACKRPHMVSLDMWTWDGNIETPAFSPSVLVTSGHFDSNFKQGDPCWCTYNEEHKEPDDSLNKFTCNRCHSFIIEGKIQYLPDCTHEYAGQTIELPDLPEYLRD